MTAFRTLEPRVIAVLRGSSADRVPDVAAVLCEAGFRFLELTLTTPGATAALTALRRTLPADVVLGMGSVLTVSDAEAAIGAGADCLVAPICRIDVIDWTIARGLPIVAGAATPTEIHQADAAGADAVKVFPAAQLGGPAFLRAVGAPLPGIPLVPTGGIGLDHVGDYLAAGAVAVGLGSPLLGNALDPGGDLDALAARAHRTLSASVPA